MVKVWNNGTSCVRPLTITSHRARKLHQTRSQMRVTAKTIKPLKDTEDNIGLDKCFLGTTQKP